MEKYLKKKRTMNECTRDLCSNDDEYKQLFNAEQLVKLVAYHCQQLYSHLKDQRKYIH
jgi:hypothetical protein